MKLKIVKNNKITNITKLKEGDLFYDIDYPEHLCVKVTEDACRNALYLDNGTPGLFIDEKLVKVQLLEVTVKEIV